jgi:hypothetical protein
MAYDAAEYQPDPGTSYSVRVAFDEERLISDAGPLASATLADRLGIEALVNESVWLAALPAGFSLRPLSGAPLPRSE